MYDFSLLLCLFVALPLRWLHTSGPEERACVSVTVDPHSHMSLLGCEGVFGVNRTNTHTALCFHHQSEVFTFFAEPNQNGCVSELSLVYQTTEMSLHRFAFVYRLLEQTVHCLASHCGKRGQGKMMRWGLSLDLVESEQANRCLGQRRFKQILRGY